MRADTTLLPSVVCSADEAEQRVNRLAECRKALRNVSSHGYASEDWRRAILAEQVRDLSVPVHLCKVSTDGEPWTCYASQGAISEWRRSGLKVEVLQRAEGRKSPESRPERGIGLDAVSGMGERADIRCNRVGLGHAQNGYRLSRLEEPDDVPDDPEERGRFHKEHPERLSSFFYAWLREGNLYEAIAACPSFTAHEAIGLLNLDPERYVYRKPPARHIPLRWFSEEQSTRNDGTRVFRASLGRPLAHDAEPSQSGEAPLTIALAAARGRTVENM